MPEYPTRIALTLGSDVTICDPRTEFDSGLGDLTVVRQLPDDLVLDLFHRHRTAVVALAHDPRLDDLALLEALQRDVFYVGALGSSRSSPARRERLRQMDFDEAALDRLCAPAGIAIGSHTPAEIAVAIAADLTAGRNGISAKR